ncbi:MAG: hypothetical protein GKR90_17920 [Pseudomonadales bacterium]|nr:hypothetical protein [Pseudomonadales bacterium]
MNSAIETLVLPAGFLVQVRVFRYLVYATLTLLTFYNAYLQMLDVSGWVPLFIVLPIVFHQLAAQENVGIQRAYAVEAILTPLLMQAVGLGMSEITVFAWLALLCNTSLLGIRSWAAALATLVLILSLAMRQVWDVEMLVIISWTIGLAILVNQRAEQQIVGKELLRERHKDTLRFLPLAFDAKTGSAHQRQWLTVAFIDLGGFTAAVERLAPEVVRDVLNEFLSQVCERAGDADGSVEKFLGDGVLCTFLSTDQTDRAQVAGRCLGAVLSVFAWIPEFNRMARTRGAMVEFSLSVGVASGYCSTGEWGRGARVDYTVIGSPVNLAYRLQNAAGDVCADVPILIDPVTKDLLDGSVLLEGPIPVSLKGIPLREAYAPARCLLLKAQG